MKVKRDNSSGIFLYHEFARAIMHAAYRLLLKNVSHVLIAAHRRSSLTWHASTHRLQSLSTKLIRCVRPVAKGTNMRLAGGMNI